jgi:hypothetical protein
VYFISYYVLKQIYHQQFKQTPDKNWFYNSVLSIINMKIESTTKQSLLFVLDKQMFI